MNRGQESGDLLAGFPSMPVMILKASAAREGFRVELNVTGLQETSCHSLFYVLFIFFAIYML